MKRRTLKDQNTPPFENTTKHIFQQTPITKPLKPQPTISPLSCNTTTTDCLQHQQKIEIKI